MTGTDPATHLGLVFVEEPPLPETVNFLLYGPPKSGKSTAAATAPGPILWVSAEGPGALAYARKVARERRTRILETRVSPQSDARQVLRDVISYVRKPTDSPVKTVVVDTIGKVREVLISQIVVAGSKNSLQQFGEVAKILREFVRVMRDEKINLVLIAHQDISDSDGERIVRPLVGGALTEELPGEVDVVAYTHSFHDTENDRRRYVAQLVEAKGRVAGDRSGGLGAVRELDLTEWLGAYRAALAPDESDVPWGDDYEGSDDDQDDVEGTEALEAEPVASDAAEQLLVEADPDAAAAAEAEQAHAAAEKPDEKPSPPRRRRSGKAPQTAAAS